MNNQFDLERAERYVDGTNFKIVSHATSDGTYVYIECKSCSHSSRRHCLNQWKDPELLLTVLRWAALHNHCRWHGLNIIRR